MSMKSAKEVIDNSGQLASLQHEEIVNLRATIYGEEKQFHIPKTLVQLAELSGKYPNATLLAGGTDIGLWVTKHHKTLNNIIYLGHVDALNTITETDDAIIIGAGTTYADSIAELGMYYPDMEAVMRRIGGTQIRNLGTIGGNIANGSPIGDMPPLLIAAWAELVLQSATGERNILLEDYFIDYGKQDLRPGEFVKSIIVMKPGPFERYFAYKISKRFESDISAVCMAMRIDIVEGICYDARIVYGGMAAIPKRALQCEQALLGKVWQQNSIDAAKQALLQDFKPMSDVRASSDYRMMVAQNLLQKCFIELNNELLDQQQIIATQVIDHA